VLLIVIPNLSLHGYRNLGLLGDSAVPSMHESNIVNYCSTLSPFPIHQISLIRSCGAALLPVTTERLQKLFGCTVLPTYDMTEWYSNCITVSDSSK